MLRNDENYGFHRHGLDICERRQGAYVVGGGSQKSGNSYARVSRETPAERRLHLHPVLAESKRCVETAGGTPGQRINDNDRRRVDEI